MEIKHGDNRTEIILDARECAVLTTILSDLEVSLIGYFQDYQENFLAELREKL